MHNDIKDMEVIENAMKRLDELQRKPDPVRGFSWPMFIIVAALAIWAVAMIAKTGGVL